MLLYGHDLYGVVSVGCDARQYLGAELIVGAYLLFLLGHADMALIYEEGFCVGSEVVDLEFVGMFRRVYLGAEYLGLFVLHHSCGICRDALALTAVPSDEHLV